MFYMADLFYKLINCKKDTIMMGDFPFDTDQLGAIKWNDIGISSFYALKKGPGYSNVLKYDNEMKKYLSIKFLQITNDWNKGWDLKDRMIKEEYEARLCKQSDFKYMSD